MTNSAGKETHDQGSPRVGADEDSSKVVYSAKSVSLT